MINVSRIVVLTGAFVLLAVTLAPGTPQVSRTYAAGVQSLPALAVSRFASPGARPDVASAPLAHQLHERPVRASDEEPPRLPTVQHGQQPNDRSRHDLDTGGAAAQPRNQPPPHGDPAQLREQVAARVNDWKGIAGVYVFDLASRQPLVTHNEETVFTAASVMKAAILLFAYVQLPEFTPEQDRWLDAMIVNSANVPANHLLAASVGGRSPGAALNGAARMSGLLADLGLEHTYMRGTYIEKGYPGAAMRPGPARDGPTPYTLSNPYLRTTPADMGRLFLMIDDCAHGSGHLLDPVAGALSPERCRAILDRLEQSGDRTRLVAGLPEGIPVAHKSGWIDDMEGDVGIVRSPGGDYILAVFLFRDARRFSSRQATATIAEISRQIYRYYNPPADPAPQRDAAPLI